MRLFDITKEPLEALYKTDQQKKDLEPKFPIIFPEFEKDFN
jgi:hypothetical protein